ncbi:ARP2/3 actin-organizing complex subunit Sop2 [Entomophthora muscae]|uniref:ARP2/3 actin-organizing complex subunit Sop2 n=1 Tax=Entomophthora muscae TaxID=34485 RepID=A0ACC2RSK8_9FUNG|nr:ARP2/3 actin-organizing complex subunit Sop2 [Entomophthora muscae]
MRLFGISMVQPEKWKPSLVQLRINRAATHVRWSPLENKFAVASGSRIVSICYFAEDNDWWSCSHLKGVKSTILSIAWHPNNVLLAVGSTDMKARVYSAFVKKFDSKPAPSGWGEKLPFNTLCAEYANPSGGWIHSVAFSPSGNALAFSGHDSSVNIAYPDSQTLQAVRCSSLPFLSLLFVNESKIVAAGHDCAPVIFEGSEQGWSQTKSLDTGKEKKSSSVVSAFNKFKSIDSHGTAEEADTSLNTIHQNIINDLRPYESAGDGILTCVSSSGLDGKIIVWNLVD